MLALSIVAAMSSSVFAADQSVPTQTTTVTYTKTESYTWSVPTTAITAGSEGEVTASNVIIPHGKALTINVSGLDRDNNMTLEDTTQSANTIKAKVTFTALVVDAGSTDGSSQTVQVAEPTGVTSAGTYTGTLTFTASVNTASVN